MANRVYRFRLTKPAVDEQKLSAEVGAALTLVSGNSGGMVVDVLTDEFRSADLAEAMARRGFEFLEQDPSTTAAVAYGTGISSPFLKRTVDSDLVIPADQVLLAHRLRVDPGKQIRILPGGELKII